MIKSITEGDKSGDEIQAEKPPNPAPENSDIYSSQRLTTEYGSQVPKDFNSPQNVQMKTNQTDESKILSQTKQGTEHRRILSDDRVKPSEKHTNQRLDEYERTEETLKEKQNAQVRIHLSCVDNNMDDA